jgi:hypothetical protein
MPNLKSARPIRKVTTGSVAGAIVTLVIWLLGTVWDVKVPSEITAALTTLVSFGISYLTPSRPDDLIAASEADRGPQSIAA